MSQHDDHGISGGSIDIWPQGSPGATDDLLPDGGFGYLNEQVLWLRHGAMRDSRSALRVPEGIHWAGKGRVEDPTAQSHNYQVGQHWRRCDNRLLFEACPISAPLAPAPGAISALVEIVDDDLVRVGVALTNASQQALSDVQCHFCFNHRRAPLLGRRVFAFSTGGWVDFGQYVSSEPFRYYGFNNEKNVNGLPAITCPALFSETVFEGGIPFVSVIGSEFASCLASNVSWPCTDLYVSFGTIHPGETCTRRLFVGLGRGTKDDWLDRMSSRFSRIDEDA